MDKLAGNSEIRFPIKARQVEPVGPLGKILHLTRGGLRSESGGEVSRSQSSEEGPVRGLERRTEGVRTTLKVGLTKQGAIGGLRRSGGDNYGRGPEGRERPMGAARKAVKVVVRVRTSWRKPERKGGTKN